LDLFNNETGFILLIKARVKPDEIAVIAIGPQVFP